MEFVIVCAREDKKPAAAAAAVLRRRGVELGLVALGPGWMRSLRKLRERLDSAAVVVVARSGGIAHACDGWSYFVLGYRYAAGRPVVLFGEEPDASLNRFPSVVGRRALDALVGRRLPSWMAAEKRRAARAELDRRAAASREESFSRAVRDGDEGAATLFLASGLSPDAVDLKGVPVLCAATRIGSRSMVALLLEAGAAVSAQAGDRGNTALMDAVAGGHLSIVEDLIAAGCDLDATSVDGQSALVIAVGKNDADAVARLLEAGADPDRADKLGFSARKYAALFHDPAMAALFERFPTKGG